MASEALFNIEGFDELNRKLKTLDDRVTRREVLKIFRRLARPVVAAYRAALPKGRKSYTRYTRGGGRVTSPPGNLAKSVGAATVPVRKSDGNPAIVVRPGKRGRADGYYRFMVVPKGFRGSGRGSRKNKNTVVPRAKDTALRQTGGLTTREAQEKTAEYIRKQIQRLST